MIYSGIPRTELIAENGSVEEGGDIAVGTHDEIR